jgi:cell division protein FtsB
MNKRWLWITIGIVVIASFLLSDSVWRTFANRRAIRDKTLELQRLTLEAASLRTSINQLQTHPDTYEKLVRKELNYVRPGEKEVRFVKK